MDAVSAFPRVVAPIYLFLDGVSAFWRVLTPTVRLPKGLVSAGGVVYDLGNFRVFSVARFIEVS